MKQREVLIPLLPERYRVLHDPNGHFQIGHAFIRIGDLPTDLPLSVNPRSQNTGSRVSRQIDETLNEEPSVFALLNRGLTITAGTVELDNKHKQLKVSFPNERNFGVLDGGHTYAIINENKHKRINDEGEESPPFLDECVRVEFITGVKRTDLLADIARARNTSAQVKEESLANLQGKFDSIKTVLKNQPYFDKIAWRENEDDDSMPIGVREIIGLLTMFHPMYQDSENPPLHSYGSKGRCLEIFAGINVREDDISAVEAGFERTIPKLPDILRLYDWVHLKFADHYKNIGGFKGMEKGGGKVKLGKVMEVKHYKDEPYPLYFLKESTEFKFPDGWLYPVLASLRGLVSFKGEKLPMKWKADPFEYFERFGRKLVETTLDSSQQLGRSPNKVGKEKLHWIHLHTQVIQKVIKLLEVDTDREVSLK